MSERSSPPSSPDPRRTAAVVVAGGDGSRMATEADGVRKQYAILVDEPVLANAQEFVLQAMATEVNLIMDKAAGVSAIFKGGGLERRFRDIHTLSQQIQSRGAHFEAVGRILLGAHHVITAYWWIGAVLVVAGSA